VLADTPTWVPLAAAAVAVIGTIVGTLAGVVVTQRNADRREDVAWRREQERWEREDRTRTFEHRRESYSDFYESLREMARRAYNHGIGLSDDGELGEWQMPTFRKLEHLRLYATEALADAADEAYNMAWRWGHQTTLGQDDSSFYELQEDYDRAEQRLLTQMRADLSIPSA
jgi:hypothetical protein